MDALQVLVSLALLQKGSEAGVSLMQMFIRPLKRSAALSFAADLGWNDSLHMQKLFPPPPPPVREEVGVPKDSDTVSLQKAFENFYGPFQVQISQISGKTILQWVYPSDLLQNLKVKLEHQFGIPSALQRLIF